MNIDKIRQIADWIALREPLVWLFLAPWLLFPQLAPYLTTIALLVIPILWLVRLIAGRPITVRTPLNWPIFLLLAALGPILIFSPQLDASLHGAITIIIGTGIYYSLVNCDRQWSRPEIGAALGTLAATLISITALFSTNWPTGRSAVLDVITSNLPRLGEASAGFSPDIVGGTLTLLLPLIISFVLMAARRGRKALLGHWQAWSLMAACVALFMFLVLVFTQSRTAIFVTLVVAGFLAANQWRGAGLLVMAGLFTITILFIIGIFSGNLTQWMITIDDITRPAGGTPDSWLRRLELWRNAILAIRDYPLTGVGVNLFGPVAWLNYPFRAVDTYQFDTSTHNLWLQAGTDLGVIGFVAVLWLTVTVLLLGWAIRRGLGVEEKILYTGMWAGLVAWMGYGFFGTVTLTTRSGLLVWVILGFLVAGWREKRVDVWQDKSRVRQWLYDGIGLSVILLLIVLAFNSPIWSLNRSANQFDAHRLSGTGSDSDALLSLLEESRNLPGAARREALVELDRGNRERAVAHFASDPERVEFLVSIGRHYLTLGDIERAKEYALIGNEVEPSSGRLACLLGDVYRLEGNPVSALRFYQVVPKKSKDLSSDNERLGRCYYELGLLQQSVGWWSDAADSFALAASVDPTALEYPTEQGWSEFMSTGELSRATTIEETILESDPDRVPVILILADMYLLTDRTQKALEWAERAVATDPENPETWMRLATARWSLEKWEEAEQALDEALRLDPNHPGALALQIEWEAQ